MTKPLLTPRSPSGRIGLAILCAAGAPAVLLAPFGSIFLALPVFVVAFLHTLILGLPVYWTFRAFRWVNAGTAIGAGFLVGALPLLLFEASLSPGFAYGDHPSLTRGLLTIGSVVVDLRGPAFLGAFGATGGLAFWLALKLTGAFERPASDVSCF